MDTVAQTDENENAVTYKKLVIMVLLITVN